MKTKVIESWDSEISQDIKNQIQKSLETKGFYNYKFISEKDIKSNIQGSYLWILKYFWYSSLFLVYLLNEKIISNYITLLHSIWFIWWISIMLILLKWSVIINKSLQKSEILITNRWNLYWWEVSLWKWEDFYLSKIIYLKRKLSNYFLNVSMKEKLEELRKFWKWKWALLDMMNYIMILITYYITFPILWVLITFLWKLWFFIYKTKNRDLVFLDSSEKQIQEISQSIKSESNILKEAFKSWKYNWVWESFEKLWGLTQKSNDIWIQINEKFKNFEKVKDIFDLSMFQDWIRNEVYSPFLELEKVLSKSLEENIKASKDLEFLIEKENDLTLKNPLILQKERLKIQKEELEKYKNLIQSYLLKLQ